MLNSRVIRTGNGSPLRVTESEKRDWILLVTEDKHSREVLAAIALDAKAWKELLSLGEILEVQDKADESKW